MIEVFARRATLAVMWGTVLYFGIALIAHVHNKNVAEKFHKCARCHCTPPPIIKNLREYKDVHQNRQTDRARQIRVQLAELVRVPE